MNSPDQSRAEQQEIDASAKWPVLAFFGSALFWLLAGGVLQLIASIQLHSPSFLADCAWFTHGRVSAAGTNAFIYGWGMNAGFAFALWLMARLSAATLRSGGWLLVAAKFWNVGVFLGIAGIMTGASTSFDLLEMPRFVSLLLLGSYLLIGIWVVTTFSVRNTENVYVSQWYLLGAVFWFPWLYLASQRLLVETPVHGTVQAIANAWYVHGLNNLWFLPLALAAAYYFLPKILGKSIYDYYVAIIGFWWLSVTLAFAGGARLIGGPVPAWVGTLGTASNMLALIGVLIVCVNLFGTLAGRVGDVKKSVTLKFVVLGILGFVVAIVLDFLLSLRDVAATAQFTFIPEVRDWVVVYACFSTAMFGAAYFFLPRVTGKAWRSPALVTAHAYATLLGVVVLVVGLTYAGWQQGVMLNDASVPFANITKAMQPWFAFRTVVLMLLTLGHLAFAINFVWIACPFSSQSTPEAAIKTPPALGLAEGGHHA